MTDSGKKVCLGVVAGAHGVRGLVKVKPFTAEPQSVAAYGPVETKDGTRRFRIEMAGMGKGVVICRLEGVTDRDRAEALRGTELYVPRERLAADEEAGSWYYTDLVGLEAVGTDGRSCGRVVAVQNFGAGDLLEIGQAGRASVFLPFTASNVPLVEPEAGRIVIDPPAGLFEDDGHD